MLPHVDGLSCCKEVKRRICALSCWLACPAAGQWGSEKRARNGLRSLLCCPGEMTRAEWHQSFSLSEIFKFEPQRPKLFPHKTIIWNSFCYTFLKEKNVEFYSKEIIQNMSKYNIIHNYWRNIYFFAYFYN